MRILLVQHAPPVPSLGGATKANRLLLEGLAKRGHRCAAMGQTAPETPREPSALADYWAGLGARQYQASEDGVTFEVPGFRVYLPNKPENGLATLARAVAEFRPDRVLVSSEDPGRLLLETALAEAPGKVIYWAHTTLALPFGPHAFATSRAGTELIGACRGIIAVSRFVRSYFREYAELEAEVIQPPVYGNGPFRRLGGFGGPALLINPCAYKGLPLFLNLAECRPGLSFAAVPTWGATPEDLDTLAGFPNIEVWQPRERVAQLYARTGILMVPSLWAEAFGRVCVEAMLHAIPVLASNLGGLPEAKLGVDYLLPVCPIERYEPQLDARRLPLARVPDQDPAPWLRALDALTRDRDRYEALAQQSREAALAYVQGLSFEPFERYLEAENRHRPPQPEPDRSVDQAPALDEELHQRLHDWSPEKKRLLALLLKKKTGQTVSSPDRIGLRPRPGGLDRVPLTQAQLGLWFLYSFDPRSPVYNNGESLSLNGPLAAAVLESGLRTLFRRHEVLRMRVVVGAGEPVQCFPKERTPVLPVIDLTRLESRPAQILADGMDRRFHLAPYDPVNRPLFRVALFRLARRRHLFLLNLHHIVGDGWSIGVFKRELTALYRAFQENQPSPLKPLPFQYGDYAFRQRERDAGLPEEHLAYWKRHLAAAPILALPTDRPRPPVRGFRGGRLPFALEPLVRDRLNRLARAEGCTLFMVLIAVFAELLHRYSGQADVVVGTPVANRNRAELENLIGLFLNTLALRFKREGDPCFREILAGVKRTVMNGLQRADIPFERVATDLGGPRDRAHSPVFQAMFIMQNLAFRELSFPGIALSHRENQTGVAAKFDLTLGIWETEDGMAGFLEYNTDLFHDRTMARMSRHFQTLASVLSADPGLPLSGVAMQPEAETRQLIHEWNRTDAPVPGPKNLAILFDLQRRRSEDVAAVFEIEPLPRYLTFSGLDARSSSIAARLRDLGTVVETAVAVCLDRGVESVAAMLGVLYAGGAFVPLEPGHPAKRKRFMLTDCGARLLLTRTADAADFRELGLETVLLDEPLPVVEAPMPGPTFQHPGLAAYLLYTSGSTGRPKGVIGLHGATCNRLAWMWSVFPFDARDVCCLKTALTFVDSVWETFGPMLAGVPNLVIDGEAVEDLALFTGLLGAARVSRLGLVPSLLDALVRTYPDLAERVPACRLWISSGEALDSELANRLLQAVPRAELVNLYGSSEITADATWYRLGREKGRETGTVPIGGPIANMRRYVVNRYLTPVPIGIGGEILVGGAGLARGYHGQPAMTAERFLPDPFAATDSGHGGVARPGERLYRTGDLGRVLDHGGTLYLGRMDDQVKIRGQRVALGEIEAALVRCPGIAEAAVVLRGSGPAPRLVAYVTGNGKAGEAQWRASLSQHLPAYMLPAQFVALARLPLTPHGKLDRRALPEPGPEQEWERGPGHEPDTLAQLVGQAWAEALELGTVPPDRDFFEMGGHSLLATRIMNRLGEMLELELPARVLFEHPTVACLSRELASRIQMGVAVEIPELNPTVRDRPLPLSYAQQGLWLIDRIHPASAAYNLPTLLSLEGPADIRLLERVVFEIVRRHEILRTRFVEVDGEPGQVVDAPDPETRLPLIDLRGLPSETRQDWMVSLAARECDRPFDLAQGPLFRTLLLRHEERRHLLVANLHHIVTDGLSMIVLRSELVHCYRAFSVGEPVRLPPLPVQYGDYAVWQRQWVKGRLLERHLEFWMERLAGWQALDLPYGNLGPDATNPEGSANRGGWVPLALSGGRVSRLGRLGRESGATSFMTLLGAFAVLLHRYTGQDDILVGTAVANRSHRGLRDLVGLFVNMVPVRVSLAGQPDFREALIRVRREALAAFRHQDLPFEKLVEALAPDRVADRNPLFRVAFVMWHAAEPEARAAGLRFRPTETRAATAHFDLTCSWRLEDGALTGVLEYDTALLDRDVVARMADDYLALLERVPDHPDCPVLDLLLAGSSNTETGGKVLAAFEDEIFSF